MSIKRTETTLCDRCGEQVEKNWYEVQIGNLHFVIRKRIAITGLRFMKKQNGSGSMDSYMSLDLCFNCSNLFLAFMKNK